MLRNFSIDLSVAMLKNAGISIIEETINQIYELINHLDALRSNCTLQFYS